MNNFSILVEASQNKPELANALSAASTLDQVVVLAQKQGINLERREIEDYYNGLLSKMPEEKLEELLGCLNEKEGQELSQDELELISGSGGIPGVTCMELLGYGDRCFGGLYKYRQIQKCKNQY